MILLFIMGLIIGYCASQYVPEYFIVRLGSRNNNITFSDVDIFYVFSALFETSDGNLEVTDINVFLREIKKELLTHINDMKTFPPTKEKVHELIQNNEFKTYMQKYGIDQAKLDTLKSGKINEEEGFTFLKKVFNDLMNKKMTKNNLFKELINFLKLGLLVSPKFLFRMFQGRKMSRVDSRMSVVQNTNTDTDTDTDTYTDTDTDTDTDNTKRNQKYDEQDRKKLLTRISKKVSNIYMIKSRLRGKRIRSSKDRRRLRRASYSKASDIRNKYKDAPINVLVDVNRTLKKEMNEYRNDLKLKKIASRM